MVHIRRKKTSSNETTTAEGKCTCGGVRFEIDIPAFWAWHDHSRATQIAHASACVTYVGCWRSRVRVMHDDAGITHFTDTSTGSTRSFCSRCGTPLFFERPRSPRMVNIPRALFTNRTGREPRYHIGLSESPEWAYRGEGLAPLKGYPGVMWARPKAPPRRAINGRPVRKPDGNEP